MTAHSESNDSVRKLDRMLHAVLVAGLAVSATIIGIGLILSIVQQDTAMIYPDLSTVASDTDYARTEKGGYEAIWSELRRGTADGFLNLGMLILIVTPVLRVIGSLIDFLWIRDRRFAAITLLVLVILAAGVLSGI